MRLLKMLRGGVGLVLGGLGLRALMPRCRAYYRGGLRCDRPSGHRGLHAADSFVWDGLAKLQADVPGRPAR